MVCKQKFHLGQQFGTKSKICLVKGHPWNIVKIFWIIYWPIKLNQKIGIQVVGWIWIHRKFYLIIVSPTSVLEVRLLLFMNPVKHWDEKLMGILLLIAGKVWWMLHTTATEPDNYIHCLKFSPSNNPRKKGKEYVHTDHIRKKSVMVERITSKWCIWLGYSSLSVWFSMTDWRYN